MALIPGLLFLRPSMGGTENARTLASGQGSVQTPSAIARVTLVCVAGSGPDMEPQVERRRAPGNSRQRHQRQAGRAGSGAEH